MQGEPQPARTDLERVQALLRSSRVGGNARLRLVELEQRLKSGFLSSESRQRVRDLYRKVIEDPLSTPAASEPARPPPEPEAGRSANGQGHSGTDTVVRLLQQRVAELEARVAAGPGAAAGCNGAHADEVVGLRRRLEDSEKAASKARADAERAEQGLAQLRTAANHEANKKIRRIKRLFALHFHPDHVTATGTEREIRETVFKEFWRELDRIEREEPGG